MDLPDFEKLGSFYLGRRYDPEARRRTDEPLLYHSRDLVTHAVCVGMTGSGKTGLCLSLLEEAAIDGIPAIIIDPKGDLGNLLLTFPRLAPEDFRPWINPDDARRAGVDLDEFSRRTAAAWRDGLAAWGQDTGRIERLRAAAHATIYTPGSSAGAPVSVLRSFSPPPTALMDDTELFQERVSATVTGLLGLVGITGDPIQSREHILLSTILGHAWERGESVDLPAIIHRIQHPPVPRVGVIDLETFYPADQRHALAIRINNLIASPGFSRWIDGHALDPATLLHAADGTPRLAIFSISHLADAERMFFVTLLLNQVLGWIRAQPGTTSLRAILYMDEISGYVPPVAQPPSKAPLLTLMKQARAQGLGVVLATQNPVDIDYKGLSNAGTWFIGRLQTERDKQRVLDGLESASSGASLDRSSLDRAISGLSARVFLMRNVHDPEPTLFESRWAMSYLRGPLTRDEIRSLTLAGRPPAPPSPLTPQDSPIPSVAVAPGNTPADARSAGTRPMLAPEIRQCFLAGGHGPGTVFEPTLLGMARLHYGDPKSGLEVDQSLWMVTPLRHGPVAADWSAGTPIPANDASLSADPPADASFCPLPPEAARAKSFDAWSRALATHVARACPLRLLRCGPLGVTSRPGEPEGEFLARVRMAAREARDRGLEQLRAKYASRLATLQERVRRARAAVDVQREQAAAAQTSGVLSIGSALLGAFLGRSLASTGNVRRAASAARGASRVTKEKNDIQRAMNDLAAAEERLAALEREIETRAMTIGEQVDEEARTVTPVEIKPKRGGVTVLAVLLAWRPVRPVR